MLGRAASNAYSWWWASHIRTKQSKWLEENLQDIEEKAQYALKLLEDEGDSFAKRAEMYYKSRPELISFVEEAFKAYRALAERYDHISKELQNANTTIASVFPDQLPDDFPVDDDDDNTLPPPTRFHHNRKDSSNHGVVVPKVPEFPKKYSTASKRFQSRNSFKGSVSAVVNKSGLTKAEAVEEIDKLQKEILALQTEKEFIKGSYESGLAKYWDLENSIMEKQERICGLQDEFNQGVFIEDAEAQALMSTTALKSCQEKLAELKEQQSKIVKEANNERKRIRESKEEFASLAATDPGYQALKHDSLEQGKSVKEQEADTDAEKMKDYEVETKKCLNVPDMAEKIDELVNHVISLEQLVSSQTALVQRLRGEIDDLQVQIRALQENKPSNADDNTTVMRNKLREVEEKLKGIQDLDQMVEEQSKNLETHLTEAHTKLGCLSERLRSLKSAGEEENPANVPILEEGSLIGQDHREGKSADYTDDRSKISLTENASEKPNIADLEQKKEPNLEVRFKHQDTAEAAALLAAKKDNAREANQTGGAPESSEQKQAPMQPVDEQIVSDKHMLSPKSDNGSDIETTKQSSETEEEPFLQQLLSHGMEDREKLLLTEYTKVLRNYKEAKRKLGETETKLNNDNTMKNEEIKFLRRKLSLLAKAKGESDDLQDIKATDNQQDLLFMLIGREDNTENGTQPMSQNEQQFRTCIDSLLGKNLDLLVRFSNSIGQIQQLDTRIKDLQAEISNITEQNKQDGGTLRSNVRPIYRHLKEIHTELSVWLEKNWLLKNEINSRSSSLSNMQDEITEALRTDSDEGEMRFTIYQAAEFLGEISNMKNENIRIADELQTGLNHITTLRLEVDKTLEKLNEEFALSETKDRANFKLSNSRTHIPLRSFIFDTKPKKQRLSFFSCMQPSQYKKSKPDS
ncbi:PREDICTED: protein NETWORKED 2C [Tarenaya hassleriana]|uniref:protein NETWORKED 2C n=1 Tax=Tarenaya hassleriana TaxID=28532 RepID=UPI00053C398B|nr:PREDICTED: protein NETWORKED 2C [Tarenaya hassleriana]